MKTNKSTRLIQDVFSPYELESYRPIKQRWHRFMHRTSKHFLRHSKAFRGTTAVFNNDEQHQVLEELARRLKKHP